MKGQLSDKKWAVVHEDGNSYMAGRIVDGKAEGVCINSHCLACAKTDILARYGGEVDLRGWHKQGMCGAFLLAMAQGVIEE